MPSAARLLGPDGPFAECVEGFQARDQQRQMAQAVEKAIADQQTLVVEAGTGVGKTFAYLLPAALSAGKVIVSTGTKNLQDQLFNKDLPVVREAVLRETGRPWKLALLKGRANYLCRYRLQEALADTGLTAQDRIDLAAIREWSFNTFLGDRVELSAVAEDALVWSKVTSSSDQCLGSDCEWYDECGVYQARREAQEADLVVVNHHLLCADLGLKEEGFGELLPSANCYIVDEAHQLPEIGSVFFGTSLTSRALLDLGRDCVAEQLRDAGDMPAIRDAAAAVERAVFDLRLAFGEDSLRSAWIEVRARDSVEQALLGLDQALSGLSASLEPAAERSKGLEQCFKRALECRQALSAIDETGLEDQIHWMETFKRGFAIHMTPLDIAAEFQKRLPAQPCSWVFTSATLAVDQGFDHFCDQLGLEEVDELLLDSPFDYANNALLYLPPGLPEPNAPGFLNAWLEPVVELLMANGGHAFLLFTAHRALREAALWLERRLSAESELELFVQGSAPRALLLERFRASEHGVLLGASSFWEGVDVRGDALSLVVIDRLPFASPGDPVMQARSEALRTRGLEPFTQYAMPKAVISLKQGAGRLIRDANDRGVLVLCDPRLLSKRYGRQFLASLPPMPISIDMQDVYGFIASA